ncbi:MAG: hypothetical protein RL557_491 [archaeon]|jgi:hypothetical protein
MKQKNDVNGSIAIILENANEFPASFLEEIQDYAQRNFFVVEQQDNFVYVLCEKCFKAHVIKTARDMAVDISDVAKVIVGEIGHKGYYLDEGSVVKM